MKKVSCCFCLSTVYGFYVSLHLILFYFLGITGYITYVSPQKISSSRNEYVDVNVSTGQNTTKTIRAMLNKTTRRNLFVEKKNDKAPVVITNLSEAKSGTLFFNSNVGSRLTECDDIEFIYESSTVSSIADIKKDPPTGSFDILGKVKWIGAERSVKVGVDKTREKKVRDGVLGDQSGEIKISIWGDLIDELLAEEVYMFKNVVIQHYNGIKISTTINTALEISGKHLDVDWENFIPDEHEVTVDSVLSCKVESFLCCVNVNCGRKVVPFPGERCVSCLSCKRKMLVKRCCKKFNAEITISKTDDNQLTLTIFEKQLRELIPCIELETLEENILHLDTFKLTYNTKKIVTNISHLV